MKLIVGYLFLTVFMIYNIYSSNKLIKKYDKENSSESQALKRVVEITLVSSIATYLLAVIFLIIEIITNS